MSEALTNYSSYESQLFNEQKKREAYNCQQFIIRNVEQIILPREIKNNKQYQIGFLLISFASLAYFFLHKQRHITYNAFKVAISVSLLGYSLKKYMRHKQQLRDETIQDWERLFGLEYFKEINNEPYTKEDLDCVYKQKKIFWNPDKKKVEWKRLIAVKRLLQIEKAYQNILNYHKWN